ncbi:MAG TPA: PRC-barrel domain-containing protein, partial [Ktedonobacterales bacterium]|nr:PRC-barrel domain-containing protein [Ktedonobacterales bacterium]
MALQETPGSPDMGVVQFRIERGAAAMGSDGQLGTVEQIVVDRGSGELRALVVQRSDGQEFELPATHIKRTTGDHVYLDVGAADLANNPEIAAPYDPEQYVPVYEGQMAPTGQAARAARDAERPVVTNVEEDAAQVIAPTTSTDAAAATATDAEATMTLPRSGTQPAPTAQPSPVES